MLALSARLTAATPRVARAPAGAPRTAAARAAARPASRRSRPARTSLVARAASGAYICKDCG